MRKAIFWLTSILVTGCATPDFNYRPDTTNISQPPLNQLITSYVGDTMLRQGKYTEHEAIYITEKIDVGWAYDLLPGYYLKKGEDKQTETFYPGGGDESGHITKAALADPWSAVMTHKQKDKICVITVFNATSCKKAARYERRKKPVLTHDSFQQTLIYSGKVGTKINISYREFSNSLARPAFNNDVEYDLSSSPTIGYKGARITVLKATNEYIKYRVLSNFNKAAL